MRCLLERYRVISGKVAASPAGRHLSIQTPYQVSETSQGEPCDRANRHPSQAGGGASHVAIHEVCCNVPTSNARSVPEVSNHTPIATIVA